jgi:hypothetical protein
MLIGLLAYVYPPNLLFIADRHLAARTDVHSAFKKASSAVRAAAVDGRDNRHAHGLLYRQNDGLHPKDVLP